MNLVWGPPIPCHSGHLLLSHELSHAILDHITPILSQLIQHLGRVRWGQGWGRELALIRLGLDSSGGLGAQIIDE